MQFTYNTITRFNNKIRYRLDTYLDAYRLFVENSVPQLQEYYINPKATIDVSNFDMLDMLMQQSIKVDNKIKINRNKFSKIDEWELAAFLEDIKMKLDTYNNFGKWLRSSKSKNGWRSVGIQANHALGQSETLEQVVAGLTPDEQNSWVNLSLENNLMESDYTVEGGNIIRLTKVQDSSPNFFLESVVDNLSGERLYGRDFCRKLTFEDDDLLCLSYQDTVKQSINILVNLKRFDIPEFPTFGTMQGVGTNIGTYTYSSYVRQLTAVFESDDTLRNFKVLEFYYKDGDLYLKYSVDTFFNLTYNNETAKIS